MITRFNREELAQNLPDAYRKDKDSNNAKILEIEKAATEQLRSALGAIYESLDLNNAYGKTLDLFGDMIGQRRGVATDEQYRILIKSKIARNYADADYNSIIRAICLTFDCEPNDIIFTELDEPCKVSFDGLPISKLNEANIDMATAVAIINALMPVGIYMESMNFLGTFEFSGQHESGADNSEVSADLGYAVLDSMVLGGVSVQLVYDEDKGFGDIEQTIGGYLGLVSDGAGSNLPV